MSHLYISFDPADVDTLFELHEVLRKANIADAFRSATEDTPLPKIDDMARKKNQKTFKIDPQKMFWSFRTLFLG